MIGGDPADGAAAALGPPRRRALRRRGAAASHSATVSWQWSSASARSHSSAAGVCSLRSSRSCTSCSPSESCPGPDRDTGPGAGAARLEAVHVDGATAQHPSPPRECQRLRIGGAASRRREWAVPPRPQLADVRGAGRAAPWSAADPGPPPCTRCRPGPRPASPCECAAASSSRTVASTPVRRIRYAYSSCAGDSPTSRSSLRVGGESRGADACRGR
jgi:hypothetical protein